MNGYRYRAARADGERVAGTLRSASQEMAAEELSASGLLLLDLKAIAAPSGQRALPRAALGVLLGGLGTLLRTGLPADRALTALATDAPARMRRLLQDVLDSVRQGSSLATALERCGGLPPTLIGAIRAGELHGNLGDTLQRLARDVEQEAELVSRMKAALTYPVILVVAGTASIAVIVGVVIPRFASLLQDLGQSLPPATRVLLAVGKLGGNGPFIGVGALGLTVAGWWIISEPAARYLLHSWLLRLPVIGHVQWQLGTAQTGRALSSMLATGVPILAALDLCARATANPVLQRRLHAAQRDVSEGSRLATAFSRHGVLTPAAQQLLHFGDEAGRVSDCLEEASRTEAGAAYRSMASLITLIEPLLVLLFGAIVAFVALALLQAVYSVRP